MVRQRLALALVAMALNAGCSGQPKTKLGTTQYRLALGAQPLRPLEAIKVADFVVVGTVRGVELLGQAQVTDKAVHVRLWTVTLQVQYAVKGALPSQAQYFLYNYDVLYGVQNGDFEFWLSRGFRGLFFLRRDGALLRAVTDLYRTTVPFPRSALPDISRYADDTVDHRIVRLLLTPGVGRDADAELAAALKQSVGDSLTIAGYRFVDSLVKQIAASADPALRRAGCLAAYEQLFGSVTCVEAMEKEGVDLATQARLRQDRADRRRLRRVTAEALNAGAASPLPTYAPALLGGGRDNATGEVDLFHFLTGNSDPVFRKSAALELARLERRRLPRRDARS